MGAVYLETARLRLREVTHEDVDLLMELDGDPEVVRYVTRRFEPPVRGRYLELIDAWRELYRRWGGRYGYWVAEMRGDGAFIGWFHLRPDKADRDNGSVLELGYRLRRAAWGRGCATEGSRALIARAFEEFGADEVFATTVEENRKSVRVMEKAGLLFAEAFVDRFPDGFTVRALRYAITREQYRARHAGERPARR